MIKKRTGRHTKLTHEVRENILASVRNGFTLGSAARISGTSRSALFRHIAAFREFRDALRAAQKEAREISIKGNPRSLRRARIELRESPDEIKRRAYLEIMRICEEGRVPKDLMLDAVRLAERDIEDVLADESFTWVEKQALGRAHPGRRGLGDDTY